MKLLLSMISLALTTLRENKTRSVLTVLGVIIGTGTIIAIGSILTSLDGAVTGVIRSMGTNTAIVFKMRLGPSFAGRTNEEKMRKPLTYDDAIAIAERCPSVERVGVYLLPPSMYGALDRARYKGNDFAQPQMAGTDENYATSGQADMKAGRVYNRTEKVHNKPVTVIGEDLYRALFGPEDAIGKHIVVDGQELEVIGVMNRPATSLPGQQDNRILIPYFTMRKMFPTAQELLLMAQARPGELPEAIDELRAVLRIQRHVKLSAPDNFHLHSRPDGRGFPSAHLRHRAGHGRVELHWAAGRRHRGHEHHARLGDRAHPRDRRPQGHWSAPFRYRGAISDRSGRADRTRRTGGNAHRVADVACQPSRVPQPPDRRAAVGRRSGSGGLGGCRTIFRHLAGQPCGAA